MNDSTGTLSKTIEMKAERIAGTSAEKPSRVLRQCSMLHSTAS
jgi:hypothetical protein